MDDTKVINMPAAGVLADDDVFYVVQDPTSDIPLDRKVAFADLRTGLQSTPPINETPLGLIDGMNTTFTLTFTPAPGSLCLYKNGLLQEEDSNADYTLAGNTITFVSTDATPLPGDKIRAVYRKGT